MSESTEENDKELTVGLCIILIWTEQVFGCFFFAGGGGEHFLYAQVFEFWKGHNWPVPSVGLYSSCGRKTNMHDELKQCLAI